MFLFSDNSQLKKFEKYIPQILICWIILLSFLYSTLSLIRHTRFQSGGFDLGIYDQAVWQYSHLLSPYNTVKERLILGDHLNLTLPLLAPLFFIWDDVRILLLFQAIWVVFSTFAIFKICTLRGLSSLASLLLSINYSLFYGIQYLIFFDFHPIALGVGLLPWLIYFMEKGNKKLFILILLLTLLTQENMGLALISLGFIYFFKKRYRKVSVVIIIIGAVYSYLAIRLVSFFSPIGFQYQPQIIFNLKNFFVEFFNSEEKRLVWLYSYSWFSFLPLFSIGSLMAVVFDLAQYFTTGQEFSRMWSPFMHHRAILAIFLFLGVLDVLDFLKNKKIKIELIIIILIISALFQQFYFHYPLNKLSKSAFWNYESWMKDNEKLFTFIPEKASLSAQQSLVPHLSHRPKIYLIYPRKQQFSKNSPCGKTYCWWLDFGGKPELMVVDLHPNQWLTQLLESNENFNSAINNMEKTGKIKLVKAVNNAKLYKVVY